ncbi:MAG: PDDEXK nuclease domain-containing protein [Euryarchaeota archaeon]|nr:PDDEXK nuclease domain-containing protein [Euryarchaeota archaeon]
MNKHNPTLPSDEIYLNIRRSVITAQRQVYAAVNCAMVQTYREVGEQIYCACGENFRAEYGKNLLKFLSEKLTKEFGSNFSERNLRYMRQFYAAFPIRNALRSELSWTHYRLLMRVSDEKARDFYMDECAKSNWSSRQLERQINSFFYERLLASRDKEDVIKEDVIKEAESGELKPEYERIIKDPYVLEFLNLEANPKFYEKDLEEALITNLQKFLLELGRGFSFVSRQKRISFDGRHFYIDLVFYNYILKCFVLIDLKLGDLTHQDLGQMQMYVNYYTREMRTEGDNPPVGIVLCADKSDAVVRYTLPEDNSQIFASKYMLYMPTEEEFKRELNLDEFRKMSGDSPEDEGGEQ